jgi:ATP-binding cassette, subfamily C (CFTR/MRP), member 1
MTSCQDGDGWGPVSRDRDFDLTLCFELGVLLPTLFAVLFVLEFVRTLQLVRKDALPRTARSRRILNAKLVSNGFSIFFS